MSDNTPLPLADISKAPLPTDGTQRYRRNPLIQTWKFAVFNARIMRMVLKGKH